MKLEILGTGCSKCKALMANTEAATKGLGIDVEIVKIEDISTIMKYGVMSTPALVIDGKVAFSGSVQSVEVIKQLLTEVRS
jgi:small redox-active disulfide protein 2